MISKTLISCNGSFISSVQANTAPDRAAIQQIQFTQTTDIVHVDHLKERFLSTSAVRLVGLFS